MRNKTGNKQVHRITKALGYYCLILGITVILNACGSEDKENAVTQIEPPINGGEIEGTGVDLRATAFTGKAAVGAALAGQNVRVKALSGGSVSVQTNSAGNFTTPTLTEQPNQSGPYLLSVSKPNGGFLFSVGHSQKSNVLNDGSLNINVNIHPFTDLITRYWFTQKQFDIDAEFLGDSAITQLPTVEELDALAQQFLALLRNALNANQVPASQITQGKDLFTAPFEIGDNFDRFLDNTQVSIIDNAVTITALNPSDTMAAPTIIINNISLAVNIFVTDQNPPPVADLRAMKNSEGYVALVWAPPEDDSIISGYQILRDGQLIATTLFPSFIDVTVINNSQYDYAVVAINSIGLTSIELTVNIVVTDPIVDIMAPQAPSSIIKVADDNNAFTWVADDITDVAQFEILRGTSANNITTLLGSTTSTFFKDTSAPAGVDLFYSVIAIDASGNRAIPSSPVSFIIDDQPIIDALLPSTLEFVQTEYLINESTRLATLAVSRSGDTQAATSVNFATQENSALAGIDFKAKQGTLIWAAGEAGIKEITIDLYRNNAAEGAESFNIELSSPAENSNLGNKKIATVNIEDAPQEQCTALNDDITLDTQLSDPCYSVTSNIAVNNNATLSIAAGTELIFNQGRTLSIANNGRLIAKGTSAAPIIFTAALKSKGFWEGISISSSATSTIEHVIIEYAGIEDEAALTLNIMGSLALSNTAISESLGFGFAMTNEDQIALTQFTDVTIKNCNNYPAVISPNFVGIMQGNNIFENNKTVLDENKNKIKISNGSELTLDQKWHNFNVPYVMPRIVLDVHAQLEIEAGTTLEFIADSQLKIEKSGSLSAIGNAQNPIIFTGTNKTPGFWDGIYLNTENKNVMRFVIVEYAGQFSTSKSEYTSNILVNTGELDISNSTIQHSDGYGIDAGPIAVLNMNNNILSNNRYPIRIHANNAEQLDTQSTYINNQFDHIRLYSSANYLFNQDQTFKKLDADYLILGTTPMSVRSHLTIEPGVNIIFGNNAGLNIASSAALTAQGTPEQPITFTGREKSKGFWDGIQVNSNSEDNIINHAIIEYAGELDGFTNAALTYYHNSKGTLSNTHITHSQTYGLAYSVRDGMAAQLTIGENMTFSENTDQDIFTYSTISL